uniref:Fibroblast growth factor 21 n=1 Tax=Periophthalmus magnuspinnatus TaxID=409849 RepID=A0A3B4A8S7_9GOBI
PAQNLNEQQSHSSLGPECAPTQTGPWEHVAPSGNAQHKQTERVQLLNKAHTSMVLYKRKGALGFTVTALTPHSNKRAYLREDCSFREQVLADGYSAYSSDTHGLLLSLGSPRQRQRGRDRGAPALAQFLPRVSTLEGPALPRLPPSVPPLTTHPQEPLEHMEAFGKLSQIIHSPSFHER